MSTASICFEPWCIEYHRTMAATLTVGQAVKRGAWILSIAKDFWEVARDLKSLIMALDDVPCANAQEVEYVLPMLNRLHGSINRIVDLTHKRGLSNRAVIGAQFQSIKRHNECLLDIIERLNLSLNHSVSADAKQAREEYDRNETVSLDSLV